MDLNGRRVLVLGLGDTGWSMTRWLARHGARVRVADTRESPPHAARLAATLPDVPLDRGRFCAASFEHADLIAASPGVALREPEVDAALRRGVPVTGDIDLFAHALPARGEPGRRPLLLAITGSNGKSTVTAMAGAVCEAAGLDTVVAGNIGLPVLDALEAVETGDRAMPDCFVLELSSFQLETTTGLDADVAAVLNVSEDHLDRYDDMDAYARAKARIFDGTGVQVLNREDSRARAMAISGREQSWFGADAPRDASEWGIVRDPAGTWLVRGTDRLMPVTDLPVAGLHNAANALAALALAEPVGAARGPALAALRGFRGLAHRMSLVAEFDGVAWYDDSKGTNVGATVAALAGMDCPVVLIAGGDGKGQDFSPLCDPVRRKARAVILIGRDAGRIAGAITPSGIQPVRVSDMEAAVDAAARAARPGDAVLLSPACASTDMFRNYGHRAEVFVGAVKARALVSDHRSRA